jgi:hypothetical protein
MQDSRIADVDRMGSIVVAAVNSHHLKNDDALERLPEVLGSDGW